MNSIIEANVGSQERLCDWDTSLESILSSTTNSDLLRILSATSFASHKFFQNMGAVTGMFPITTQTISSPMGLGSDSVPVTASIQGINVYLPDSLQFVLELGCRVVDGPCYYVMPSFRGENADERHLCEFFHAEVEILGDLDDVMNVAESYVRFLTGELLELAPDAISRMADGTEHLRRLLDRCDAFSRLTFHEALDELSSDAAAFATLPDGTMSITAHGEKRLIAERGDFVWLMNMPWSSVPFYQRRLDGSDTAANADLLAGCGEILGSGERAADGTTVIENLALQEVDPGPYEWYIKMKECRPLQTSGFGLGIERYLMWVLQQSDIRKLALLRREWGKSCTP